MGGPKLSQSLKVLIIILGMVSAWEAILALKAALALETTQLGELPVYQVSFIDSLFSW